MIPFMRAAMLGLGLALATAAAGGGAPQGGPPPGGTTPASPAAQHCLESGDGYFRARIAGAVDATVDWPNEGTHCEGEPKYPLPGVRLSFQHSPSHGVDLLFVFGLTGVVEGRDAHEVGTNLTVIVQGTDRFYGTRGYSRCTVDSLTQRRLGSGHSYRVEARGFCTQPARAVRGDDAVLVSTFEFAGLVNYDQPNDDVPK